MKKKRKRDLIGQEWVFKNLDKTQMKTVNIFIRLVIIFCINLSFFNISNSSEKNYYKDLITDWSRIFPDNNRNAAGPKFFKYIIDKDITYKDFIEYNKLYCAVSGSLIDPNSSPDFVNINEEKTERKMCGNYYKCCIPCSCDLMKYTTVKKMKYKFKDGVKEFFVLTIDNPCSKKDFPTRVTKKYFCDGNNISKDQVYNLDGRMVIGLFHNSKPCSDNDIKFIKSHPVTGEYCDIRNNTPIDELQTGMGDIFIKMAR